MSLKAEEIRQAKKFLENNKYSIKDVKPRLFALVAKNLNVKFSELLKKFERAIDGTINSSDKKTD